ncbi:ATP-dependent RNA helicase A [Mucinivorans hirudinis]|uniref:ATP-dependent RNA helicase A n=1 Tax=Mucinivorans hirudinis TaxID=1433126 RepID=A0A060RC53_9BACT|nr:ATP-dependent RNA helicase A [Mucinivorans hirudinis]
MNLPRGFKIKRYSGIDYYYSEGRYYRRHNGHYYLCRPPFGAVIAGAIVESVLNAIIINNQTYYYGDGTFYIRTGGNYRAVQPPIGARIAELPYGAQELYLNGEYYYQVDDTYYMPVYDSILRQEVYEVVGKGSNGYSRN